MEFLDRYLESVRKHLPWERQDDIIAELRANLEAQLDEKEAALGRPLTKAEGEEWVKALGPPMQVAAGYQPQRYLIGPAFFPMYWYVLKMALGWAAVIYSIVTVVTIFVQKDPSAAAFVARVLQLPMVLITTTGWVTGVFVALEYAASRKIIDLKEFPAAIPGWAPAGISPIAAKGMGGKKPRTFAQSVAEVVFGLLFLCWLLLVPSHPYLLMGPGAYALQQSPYQITPALTQFFLWVVALNIFQLGWKIVELYRGTWGIRSRAQHLMFSIVGLIPVWILLTVPGHRWILLKHPGLDQAKYGITVDTINSAIYKALLLIVVIVVVQLVWELVRRGRDDRRRRLAAR